jgi:hypothetical protein
MRGLMAEGHDLGGAVDHEEDRHGGTGINRSVPIS